MKKNFIIILLVFCQTLVFAQDKKVMKIAKYIEKGKGTEAKELLDELDSKKEYQTDIYYWFVRTIYYRNVALVKTDSPSELAEARKSFEKLVEFDKTDQSKSFTQYIPQIRKDLYEGKNQSIKSTGSSSSISQANDNEKTVTLTQIGQGKTKDAAKYNALRNAIEKAFGTFISSNTTLLNDELVKDEIVSVSTGNIQNFEILSETQMPDGSFSSVVKATVSIGKLTTFCESKGIAVEFKGGLFAANIKLQELNKKNEEAVMKNLYTIANKITSKGLYVFSIKADEPISILGGYDAGKWDVQLNTSSEPNKNLSSIIQMLVTTLRNISLSETELQDYKSKQITAYKMTWDNEIFYFRNIIVIETVMKIIGIDIPRSACMFKIKNGITQFDFPYNVNESFNYYDNLEKFSDSREAFKSKTGVTFGKVTRFPTNEDDYKMLIEYDKVYNPSYYNYYGKGIVVNTSKLFIVITNEVHNILDLEELQKITEYKIEPINK